MGRFHPGHRARPELYIKKRRNNRVLESFYDARYIDSRDGKRKPGKELFNGRISRNHKKDSENLHKYRLRKVSKGKRCIRKKHYPIQPHDILVYCGRKYETAGCHNLGTGAILLPERRSIAVSKLKIYRYSGGYYKAEFN